MYALLKNECKSGFKSLMIWALSVGGLGFVCILLFQSMEDSMVGMAEQFASMGAFSEAFGMSTLSIATLKGYFATEIGTIHSLGSGMFAATLATVILSKEEDGHTAEFTFTLPLSRVKIITVKYLSVFVNLIVFTGICTLLYLTGFLVLVEEPGSEFFLYMLMQFMMNVEVAAICFLISAMSKKNKLGLGISVALILYLYDLMARVVPSLKNAAFLSPFSYANATTIFSKSEIELIALVIGAVIIIGMTVVSGMIYARRDLAS